jgi:hypothetical protein
MLINIETGFEIVGQIVEIAVGVVHLYNFVQQLSKQTTISNSY